jgi:hypothetical protein
MQTIKGKPVEAHYIAIFNDKQEFMGDALRLPVPARIEMQIVGDKMGFQLHMAQEVVIPLSRPDIVGVAFLNEQGEFLVGMSIQGNPEGRTENDEYVVRSRYMVMAPRKQTN